MKVEDFMRQYRPKQNRFIPDDMTTKEFETSQANKVIKKVRSLLSEANDLVKCSSIIDNDIKKRLSSNIDSAVKELLLASLQVNNSDLYYSILFDNSNNHIEDLVSDIIDNDTEKTMRFKGIKQND